jgi:hypothetical protein
MSGISIIYPTGLDKLLYVMILQYKSNTQFRRLKNVNAKHRTLLKLVLFFHLSCNKIKIFFAIKQKIQYSAVFFFEKCVYSFYLS